MPNLPGTISPEYVRDAATDVLDDLATLGYLSDEVCTDPDKFENLIQCIFQSMHNHMNAARTMAFVETVKQETQA